MLLIFCVFNRRAKSVRAEIGCCDLNWFKSTIKTDWISSVCLIQQQRKIALNNRNWFRFNQMTSKRNHVKIISTKKKRPSVKPAAAFVATSVSKLFACRDEIPNYSRAMTSNETSNEFSYFLSFFLCRRGSLFATFRFLRSLSYKEALLESWRLRAAIPNTRNRGHNRTLMNR